MVVRAMASNSDQTVTARTPRHSCEPLKLCNEVLILLSLILIVLKTVAGQTTEWTYSSDVNDYNWGWIANGTLPNGSVPLCNFCVNVFTDGTALSDVFYRNRTVGIVGCDGTQYQEKWAYHEPTSHIVYNNMTRVLCIDSATLSKYGVLTLQDCNSSLASQRWIWKGNHLQTEWNGQLMTLMGSLPTPQRTALSQAYSWPLTLSNDPPPSDGSKTNNFTFLPMGTLVTYSTRRFTTKGLLALNGGRFTNGDFETSSIQAGADIVWTNWDQLQPSYLIICGWVIETGPIDYVKAGVIAPQTGLYSVHLNTHTHQDFAGSLSQTFDTDAGKEYRLSFYMTGFPPKYNIGNRVNWSCSPSYKEAVLQVQLSDEAGRVEVSRNLSVSVLNYAVFVPWVPQTIDFRPSTNVTKLLFKSLNFNNSCGPMIDTVRVFRPSPPDHTLTWALVGGLGGGVLFLSVIVGTVGFVVRKRYAKTKDQYASLLKTEHARVYSKKQLSMATNKFSSILGEGAFGTVYKAVFPDGKVRAVKVEKSKSLNLSPQAAAKASEEISLLLRIHHRNLVNLTGFCINKGRQTLVFEYLPNGSLHNRLHKSILGPPPAEGVDSMDLSLLYQKVLPWDTRVKIACEVAYGLEYLHHDADPPIVHRDVKSHNILLTSTDSAKLADFGLSKAAPDQSTGFQSVETMVRGSFGYMDPQYFSTGVVSTKSDVYSYGVVLLELITGKQAIHEATSLVFWAAPHLGHPSCYHHLVDEKLRGRFNETELESLVELAKMCVMNDIKIRPSMRQAVSYLNSKNLVAANVDTTDQVPQGDGTISWEEYHKSRHYSFGDSGSGSASGSSEMIRNQFEPMPDLHPRD